MEKPARYKNKMKPNSSTHAVSAMFALFALAAWCAVYWPVFFADTSAAGGHALFVLCCIVGGALALYILSTGFLAKKTPVLSGLFALPLLLYSLLERTGLVQALTLHPGEDLAAVYRAQPDYLFGGMTALEIVLALAGPVLALVAVFIVCFHGRHKATANFFILLGFAARAVLFGYDVRALHAGYTAGTYTFEGALLRGADRGWSLLFFASLLLLCFAMHKTEVSPAVLAAQPEEGSAAQEAPRPVLTEVRPASEAARTPEPFAELPAAETAAAPQTPAPETQAREAAPDPAAVSAEASAADLAAAAAAGGETLAAEAADAAQAEPQEDRPPRRKKTIRGQADDEASAAEKK